MADPGPGGRSFAAVVVAGGSGTRLGGDQPKALRRLGDHSLVSRSVEVLRRAGADPIVVVAPVTHLEEFRAQLPVATVVPGGLERQQSVLAGLAALRADDPPIVLVHDAARPLVPLEVVRRVVEAVRAGAAAVVPVVPMADTIRRVSGHGSELVDRAELRAVQTPQGFDRATLLAAHRRFADTAVTDDAALCELAGEPVRLVEGSADAIKITTPLDLAVAEVLLAWSTGEDSR